MDSFTPTARSRVKRGRDRAHYDRETIYAILDAGLFCHIAYCVDGQPYLIPSSYGRKDDRLYLHGALANRTLKHLAQGAPAAIGVALVDGLIFARSQAYHSMNYRSVVLFGRATEVGELAARRRALTAIVEHMAPGRAGACRPPSELELKGTQRAGPGAAPLGGGAPAAPGSAAAATRIGSRRRGRRARAHSELGASLGLVQSRSDGICTE